jgi:hypothetical protein
MLSVCEDNSTSAPFIPAHIPERVETSRPIPLGGSSAFWQAGLEARSSTTRPNLQSLRRQGICANRTGAGWLVHTQNDRGLFYQNFVLALIESRACIGWHWFKYQDNDPDDPNAEPSNVDSNKGIVNRFYQPYSPLLAKMRELNLRMYELADLFDSSAELQNSAYGSGRSTH